MEFLLSGCQCFGGFFKKKKKHDNYKDLVAKDADYEKVGARTSPKMNFLYSHLDFLPCKLGNVSEEEGK